MYDNDLSNPKSVLDGYIKALVYGDINQALYYASGDWEKVKEFGLLGKWTEKSSQQRAKKRFTEHFKWDLVELSCNQQEYYYEATIYSPDNKYIVDKREEMTGGYFKSDGSWNDDMKMSPEKAESIIRKEKNLPMESEKFKVYLKKNEYGWVFDSLNEENEKLNDFIDRS